MKISIEDAVKQSDAMSYMDDTSKQFFELSGTKLEVSNAVSSFLQLSAVEWIFILGAPSKSEIDIDLISGRVISAHITNNDYFYHPMQTVLTFDKERDDAPWFVRTAHLDVRSEYRGSGLTTRMLALSASTAARAGFESILIDTAHAFDASIAMEPGGAYTATRLGFNAKLSRDIREALPSSLSECTDLLDLLETLEGREFWSGNAESTSMLFDLNPGSRSWSALRRHMAAENIKIIK